MGVACLVRTPRGPNLRLKLAEGSNAKTVSVMGIDYAILIVNGKAAMQKIKVTE